MTMTQNDFLGDAGSITELTVEQLAAVNGGIDVVAAAKAAYEAAVRLAEAAVAAYQELFNLN